MDQHHTATTTLRAAALRDLASRAMHSDLLDDRFDAFQDQTDQTFQEPNSTFVGAGLQDPETGDLVMYLGGTIDQDELHLDLLGDQSLADPASCGTQLLGIANAQLAARAQSSGIDLPAIRRIWTKPTQQWHNEFAARVSLRLDRTLHQMRAPLPTALTPVPTRSFVPGKDEEALRILNNRSFASHPDQGNQSATEFAEALAQDWVEPAGIRLYEVEGRLAGFCWTKIHDEPSLGEIYVIGVDPDFHGQGLGKSMTAAGLDWLHRQGQQMSMLYVEGDNAPAIATYKRLGFETVRTDNSWEWNSVAA